MNWKINYWTLLFAVAVVVGFIYPGMGKNKKGVDQQPDTTLACPQDSISTSLAVAAIDSFRRHHLNSPTTKNKDILYFKLPKCELREMLENKHPDSTVYANLGLRYFNTDSSLVSLYFKLRTTDNQIRYYNFSTPCPPCVGADNQ